MYASYGPVISNIVLYNQLVFNTCCVSYAMFVFVCFYLHFAIM